MCVKHCPENTFNVNYICKEIEDKCNLGEDNMDNKIIINQETTETLVRTYLSEFNYTNKHISLHINNNYSIIIYKNRECILELNLKIPKVDFKDCYDKVKREYNINGDLVIAIIDKKSKNNEQTYYSFFHPLSGYKLNAEEICKNETIVVSKNLTTMLNESNEKYDLQSHLTEQGINIFDMNDPFYTDLCYDFDNPSNRDIPLSERISTVYPDVSLCDEGCQMDSIDLESMTAKCNCKFNDIANNNIIKDNALLNNVVGEIFDIINNSNILVMKCYKYIFKHFRNSFGGILCIILIGLHLCCTLLYFMFGSSKVRNYIFKLFEKFLTIVEKTGINANFPPKKVIKNIPLKDKVKKNNNNVRFQESKKEKKRPSSPGIDIFTNADKRKIKIDKIPKKDNDAKSTCKEVFDKKTKELKKEYKNENLITLKPNRLVMSRKLKNSYKTKIDSSASQKSECLINLNIKNNNNQFFEEYLATSLDEMAYDDVIIKDHRTFCEYLKESLQEKQMIAFIFIATDPIKLKRIKIMLFILNICLYFVVIGLFYSEEYIGILYSINEEDEHFFSYITRSIDKFIYTTIVSIIIGYIADCFFIDEKKIKGCFKREKDNLDNLKQEIIGIIKEIKNRYLAFIIVIFVILVISFYYLLCFNYVYPKTQKEWIKASITIFIIMQILSVLKCLLETSLRFLSFRCKSEKLFKISKLLD